MTRSGLSIFGRALIVLGISLMIVGPSWHETIGNTVIALAAFAVGYATGRP